MKHCRSTHPRGFRWFPWLTLLVVAVQPCLAQMRWTAPLPITDKQLNGVTTGKGLFVAVGENGVVLTSGTGLAWGQGSIGANVWLLGVGFGADTFVAVGYGGALYTSPDAVSWYARSSGTTNWLLDVAYGNGLFVAVGENGTILSSPDAVTWTPRVSGTAARLGGVAFGDNQFIAAGSGGTLLSSTNGLSWTSSGAMGGQSWMFVLAYGNGTFVTVGEAGAIYTSFSHATRWVKPDSGVNLYLSGVTFGSNGYVVVGESGTILTSADGLNWAFAESPTDKWLLAVAANNEAVVAVGTAGTTVVGQAGQTVPLEIFGPQVLPTGMFQCQVRGVKPGQALTLLASEDVAAPLAQWTRVIALVASSDTASFTDPDAPSHSHRLYRISSP